MKPVGRGPGWLLSDASVSIRPGWASQAQRRRRRNARTASSTQPTSTIVTKTTQIGSGAGIVRPLGRIAVARSILPLQHAGGFGFRLGSVMRSITPQPAEFPAALQASLGHPAPRPLLTRQRRRSAWPLLPAEDVVSRRLGRRGTSELLIVIDGADPTPNVSCPLICRWWRLSCRSQLVCRSGRRRPARPWWSWPTVVGPRSG